MEARWVKTPCVYILASQRNGTLYIGVTSDLAQRMEEHSKGLVEGFTKKYGVKVLVYYEMHGTMDEALQRETRLKKWRRVWKLRLIEQLNPEWANLFDPATRKIEFGSGDREAREIPVGD